MIYHHSYVHSLSSCEIKPEKEISTRYITNSQSGQLPVALIAQLVEHFTSITEGMGSNPVQA